MKNFILPVFALLLLLVACRQQPQETSSTVPSAPPAETVSMADRLVPDHDHPNDSIPEATPAPVVDCAHHLLTTIGGHDVWQLDSSHAIYFTSGMAIDADGSPQAYCPDNKGLDNIKNAGGPGNWYGVVTDAAGNPVVQKSTDPHPGCYVSPTSLADKSLPKTDPRKYVDSEAIPYIALPGALLKLAGIKLGDMAFVKNTATGKSCYALFADGGPGGKIGEGSIYLAQQLGIANTSPRNGGAAKGIAYLVFPGSGKGNGTLRTVADINADAKAQLDAVGGEAILDCLQ